MIKSTRLILELINKSVHFLLNIKFASKIWAILENYF